MGFWVAEGSRGAGAAEDSDGHGFGVRTIALGRSAADTAGLVHWVPTIAFGLLAALVCGVLARRLGLSPIVGYLIAGVLVGPHTPGFVGDQALASQVADVGVILLMFGAGLSFSLRDLLQVRRVALPGALVASSAAALGAFVIGLSEGYGVRGAVVFGLAFTSASTVVIVRGLVEIGQLGSAAGTTALGWSVVEDLIVVLVLVLLPAIAESSASSSLALDIAVAVGRVVALAAIVFLVGPLLVPRVLALVARAKSRELFTLAVLVIAIGVAGLAAEVFGVSLALGAFLGGMVVGRTDSSHQAAADALPLRDAFAVLFFVAVGMLFDPSFVIERPGLVLGTLAVILVVKPIAALIVMLRAREAPRTAFAVAASLAQVSEFAFVLVASAVAAGLLPQGARDAVIAAVLLGITINPLLLRSAGPLARFFRRSWVTPPTVNLAMPDARSAPTGHAVLCGHGRVGRVLAELLAQRGVPFVVVESDRRIVEALLARGVHAVFGDAGSPTVLDAAGLARARALLVTVPDPVSARLAVEHARVRRAPPRPACARRAAHGTRSRGHGRARARLCHGAGDARTLRCALDRGRCARDGPAARARARHGADHAHRRTARAGARGDRGASHR
jgi:CPA2 family monovalent cation:H+ antiporter-2